MLSLSAGIVIVAAAAFAAVALIVRSRPIGERVLYGLGAGATAAGTLSFLMTSLTDHLNLLLPAAVALGFAAVAEAIRSKQ